MPPTNVKDAVLSIGPAQHFDPDVTPDDDEALPYPTMGVEVTGDGDLTVTTEAGIDATIEAVSGRIYPVSITHVKATGTTATGIFVYYYVDLS